MGQNAVKPQCSHLVLTAMRDADAAAEQYLIEQASGTDQTAYRCQKRLGRQKKRHNQVISFEARILDARRRLILREQEKSILALHGAVVLLEAKARMQASKQPYESPELTRRRSKDISSEIQQKRRRAEKRKRAEITGES